MKMVQLATCLLAVCLTFATAEERKAIAVLTTPNGTDVQGNITFVQAEEGSEVHITGVITGLSPGQHGFHVHEKGDLTGGCGSTGGHFNPENKNHGGPKDQERHVGDLGQIQADANQVATVDIHDNVISLYGAHSILGRAVVIHAGPDDMGKGGTDESRRTGSAGARLACGVIGIQHPITPWIESAAAPTEAGVTFIIAALLAASLITLV